MKSLKCRQATVLLSYLGVFSLATANPLPENLYGSDLDYVDMFNGDDLGSSGINWDDTSVGGSDQGDQTLLFDSAFTTDFSNLNLVDGSLIAYGQTLKAPYCGTTEQPVCCSQLAGFKDCRRFDPTDFVNCKGPNQACCRRIIAGAGEGCYKGTPEWVEVAPSPGEAPEEIPQETPEIPSLVPIEPATPNVDPIDWGRLFRIPEGFTLPTWPDFDFSVPGAG